MRIVCAGVGGVASLEERQRGGEMSQQEGGGVGERLWQAFDDGDWDGAGDLMHDDFVQEWPQSGERIVGRDNAIAINRDFPGGLPTMTIRRTLGAGDLEILEVELTYADGSRYFGVSVMELRDGKVVRETDYFAEPFPAPEWRSQWVERSKK
jgi:ketosteroid isomerase-like protein